MEKPTKPPPKPTWYNSFLDGNDQRLNQDFAESVISGTPTKIKDQEDVLRSLGYDDPYKQ